MPTMPTIKAYCNGLLNPPATVIFRKKMDGVKRTLLRVNKSPLKKPDSSRFSQGVFILPLTTGADSEPDFLKPTPQCWQKAWSSVISFPQCGQNMKPPRNCISK